MARFLTPMDEIFSTLAFSALGTLLSVKLSSFESRSGGLAMTPMDVGVKQIFERLEAAI